MVCNGDGGGDQPERAAATNSYSGSSPPVKKGDPERISLHSLQRAGIVTEVGLVGWLVERL